MELFKPHADDSPEGCALYSMESHGPNSIRPRQPVYIATEVDSEIALIKAALRWALQNGAMICSDGHVTDNPPPRFAAVIAEAVEQATKK